MLRLLVYKLIYLTPLSPWRQIVSGSDVTEAVWVSSRDNEESLPVTPELSVDFSKLSLTVGLKFLNVLIL